MDLSESNGLEKRNGDQLDPQLIPQFGAPIGMVPGTGTGTGTPSPFPLWPGMPNLSNPMAESFNPNLLNQSSSNKFLFSGVLPPSIPNFSSEPGFIERAARLSCFGANGAFNGLMNTQKGDLNSMSIGSGSSRGNQLKNQGNIEDNNDEINNEGAEDKISNGDDANANGDSSQSDSGVKKRKRTNQDGAMEQGQASMKSQEETGKPNSDSNKREVENNNGGKNTGKNSSKEAIDASKGDYIHVRARRGQATNSHSLAERVRREKISERMKYLQELVPGCSKVTGKAVMLDEIINYVQSLQRQVEFLSMKLAAVNPRLDLNIEALLSKDILHGRGGCSSSVGFTPEMFHSQLHPSQPGLLPPGLPGMLNPSDPFRRAINTQLSAINAFKDPNPQMPPSWQDELHNVMSMNFATNPSMSTQEVATKPGDGFQL